MSKIAPEAAPEMKKCVVCAAEIERHEKECPICHSEPDGQKCHNCKKRMPMKANFCNECRTYQDWRQYSVILVAVVSFVVAFGGVFSYAFSAWSYLSDRDSHTMFKVTSSTNDHIYLKAWNTGRKPSTLLRFRLSFDDNVPIKDATLRLAFAAREHGTNVIAPGAPVLIELTAEDDLVPLFKPGSSTKFTKDEIRKRLKNKQVLQQPLTFTIDVEESDDMGEHSLGFDNAQRFHSVKDRFPVENIKEFVTGGAMPDDKKKGVSDER